MSARKLFLTLFGTGLSPIAPGTIGTLFATLLAIPLLYYVHPSTLLLLALLIGAIAAREIDKEEQLGAQHDDKSIVIDELVGVWIAFSMIEHSLVGIVLAVLFFRLFDIWKPSLIGRIDRNVKGGLGVVGDDALAGFFAGIATSLTLGALGYFGFSL